MSDYGERKIKLSHLHQILITDIQESYPKNNQAFIHHTQLE